MNALELINQISSEGNNKIYIRVNGKYHTVDKVVVEPSELISCTEMTVIEVSGKGV